MSSCLHDGELRRAGQHLWCASCGALQVNGEGRWTQPKNLRKRRAFRKPLMKKKGGKSKDASGSGSLKRSTNNAGAVKEA